MILLVVTVMFCSCTVECDITECSVLGAPRSWSAACGIPHVSLLAHTHIEHYKRSVAIQAPITSTAVTMIALFFSNPRDFSSLMATSSPTRYIKPGPAYFASSFGLSALPDQDGHSLGEHNLGIILQ